MLPLSYNRKKLRNLSHLRCGPQIHHIWIQLMYMYNIRITDLNELKQQLGTEWTKLYQVVIVAAIRRW